jgi:hypothetical protein
LLQTLFIVTSASAKRSQNCNRQRTPGIALRATPTSGLISFSLAKFGRLNCLQGTQIAANVDLTLKNIKFWFPLFPR